jgi:hypothetical protein
MSSVLISRAASTSGFAGETAAATSGRFAREAALAHEPKRNREYYLSHVPPSHWTEAGLTPQLSRSRNASATWGSPRGMIAEPLASSCEEGATRPPRVIFPNSKPRRPQVQAGPFLFPKLGPDAIDR